MFYAIINYHAILDKWTEKRKEVGEANSSNLKVLIDWECAFLYSLWIIFLVGGPWKYNVVLEESLKSGCLCLYEPWPSPVTQLTVFLSYPPIPDFLRAPAPSFARFCDSAILRYFYFIPLNPNIHMQILHTDLHTFSWKTSGENLSKDQSIFT